VIKQFWLMKQASKYLKSTPKLGGVLALRSKDRSTPIRKSFSECYTILARHLHPAEQISCVRICAYDHFQAAIMREKFGFSA
jgi:hypothetical protein